jgi:hypothetical protein
MIRRADIRREGPGMAASIGLHLAFALILLWWHLAHPARPPQPLPALAVDLVAQPLVTPGPRTAPARGGVQRQRNLVPPPAAPRILGESPKAAAPLPDALEARIQGLANLTQQTGTLPAADNGGGGTGSGAYALADYVRAQILRRWWPALESDARAAMPVALRLKMSRNGALSDIRIVDQARFGSDKQFHDMALSARNAALNASPIALPPGSYPAVTELAITLDPKAVLR